MSDKKPDYYVDVKNDKGEVISQCHIDRVVKMLAKGKLIVKTVQLQENYND